MTINSRVVALDLWHLEAKAKFGLDPKTWKFVCPSCGHVQTLADFLELGLPQAHAQNFLAFSCIGRWRTTTRKAHLVVGFGDPDRGAGCTYAGGGLLNISPVALIISPGEERLTFEFAP